MEKDTPRFVKILLRYLVLTAAALLVVVVFRRLFPANPTTVALAFLMLVLVTASRWRLAYSVYLSVLCTVLYNFFFLPPVGRLTIAEPNNWVALAAFLACSVLVSHLSEQEHQHAENAERGRREVERLYEFSQQLLLQENLRSVARTTPSVVAAVFGCRAVALYVREEDAAYYSDPRNELLPLVDLKLVASEGEAAVAVRDGVRVVPLALGMHSLGVLAFAGGEYSTQVYEAIGSLVAIALERAVTVERSSRLEASRQSERLRTALLDSVTHDLRTPLTSIRAAATTLVSQHDLAEAERAELATVVDEESARLDRLIGQAVEMAQLDADAVQIKAQPQDVRELMEMAVEEMRTLLKDRSVEVEVASDVRRVPMDRALVHRVLRHLIENAVKYSPAGSPIQLSAVRDEYRLRMTVADRGPGVEPSEQPFVFDKFFRGRQQRGQAGGTGMGLAIVKAIVEAHGGGIELISEAGKGSKFAFWLPMGLAIQAPALRAPAGPEIDQASRRDS
jgi:two-component system sensor histidine kinase KdpD